MVSNSLSFKHADLHGRHVYTLENNIIRLSICRGGGHIGEIRFLNGNAAQTVNPLRGHITERLNHTNSMTFGMPLFTNRARLAAFLPGYMGTFYACRSSADLQRLLSQSGSRVSLS